MRTASDRDGSARASLRLVCVAAGIATADALGASATMDDGTDSLLTKPCGAAAASTSTRSMGALFLTGAKLERSRLGRGELWSSVSSTSPNLLLIWIPLPVKLTQCLDQFVDEVMKIFVRGSEVSDLVLAEFS